MNGEGPKINPLIWRHLFLVRDSLQVGTGVLRVLYRLGKARVLPKFGVFKSDGIVYVYAAFLFLRCSFVRVREEDRGFAGQKFVKSQ